MVGDPADLDLTPLDDVAPASRGPRPARGPGGRVRRGRASRVGVRHPLEPPSGAGRVHDAIAAVGDHGTATATATYRVDRLVAREMVARTDHPDDLRSRLVMLLPEGRTRVDAAMRQLVAAEAELIRGLDRAQVATVVEALRTIATVSSKASPRPGARRPR